MKRSGLGRNLSALLSTNIAPLSLNREEVVQLSLQQLVPGKYQPRRSMDEEALATLAASIQAQGVLQPLLVREIGVEKYEIIAGERRFRACQKVNLLTVPVLIKRVDDETAMAIALVENLQRETLNPIDQARAFARLTQEFSLTHEQIAKLLSSSRATISNSLRLLQLPQTVMSLVEQERLHMGHARALLPLEEKEQIRIANKVIAKDLSVRETEQLVQKLKQGKISTSPPSLPPHIQAQLEGLEHQLQAKVWLKNEKEGKGKLVIPYASLQDLESLLASLCL